MDKVMVTRCSSYEEEGLFRQMDGHFKALGVYPRLKPGMTVVLKPNLIMRSKPEQAIITHPAVTAAVGLCVMRAGCKVLIAESPGGTYSPGVMKRVYEGCGYTEMAQHHGFELYTQCKSREVSLPQGRVCRRLTVIEPFLERDFFIDIAKLKTHGMMGFSGAVKNLFGTVPGLLKPELHCRYPEKAVFADMLLDLCDFIKPDFSVIDGICAMEGNGPTGGERRFVGALLSGASPYALDVAGAGLVGLTPSEILTLKAAAARGWGPRSLQEVLLCGDEFSSLVVKNFKRARSSSVDFIDRLPGFLRPLAKRLATPKPVISQKSCRGCGKCAESCPQHIISVEKGKAYIEPESCIRCYCCHEMCLYHAVDIKRLGIFKL